jgi:outer membrane protein assembly factor BamB
LELYAVSLDGNIRWHTPIQRKISSLYVDHSGGRIYAGTQTGELLILDEATGILASSIKLAAKHLMIHHADGEAIVISSEKSLYGLQPWAAGKRWEFPIAPAPNPVTYFKGIVAARTSDTQVSALDVHTGAVVWQVAGKHAPAVFTTKDSFYVIAEDGIKEYAVEAKAGVAAGEVWTELASALLSKGDIQEAENVADKVAREIDPDSVALHAVRARLYKANGNTPAAAAELGTFIRLVGPSSLAGQEALAQLKQDHGVMWYEPLEMRPIGDPVPAAGRLISIGRSGGAESQIIALTPDSGKQMWRVAATRFSDIVTDGSAERAWQVAGDGNDPAAVVLYALSLGTGERKEIARWTRPRPVTVAAIAYEHERIFIATVSPDLQRSRVAIAIDCFNSAGTRLWSKADEFAADLPEMQLPLGVFAPHGVYFAYSVGPDLWTLNVADGTVVHHHHEDSAIAPRLFRNAPPDADLIYYLTAKKEIAGYHPARGVVAFRVPIPDLNFNFFVREGVLYGTDTNSVFAFDLNQARMKWRLDIGRVSPLLKLFDEGPALGVVREDGRLLRIDQATGAVVTDRALPWTPSGFYVHQAIIYAFAGDGAAFAVKLAR